MSKAKKQKPENQQKNTSIDQIENKDKALVLFYASWCPYSQIFLPIFEEYAAINPQECLSIIIDDKPDLCEQYAIEYYPTVLLFRQGKVSKRIDAKPGVGLTKSQLNELATNL
jgi:thioredoxin 1